MNYLGVNAAATRAAGKFSQGKEKMGQLTTLGVLPIHGKRPIRIGPKPVKQITCLGLLEDILLSVL